MFRGAHLRSSRPATEILRTCASIGSHADHSAAGSHMRFGMHSPDRTFVCTSSSATPTSATLNSDELILSDQSDGPVGRFVDDVRRATFAVSTPGSLEGSNDPSAIFANTSRALRRFWNTQGTHANRSTRDVRGLDAGSARAQVRAEKDLFLSVLCASVSSVLTREHVRNTYERTRAEDVLNTCERNGHPRPVRRATFAVSTLSSLERRCAPKDPPWPPVTALNASQNRCPRRRRPRSSPRLHSSPRLDPSPRSSRGLDRPASPPPRATSPSRARSRP